MHSLFTEISERNGRRPAGWLFFDADCAFCSELARWLEPALLRRGFHCSPLQDRWVAFALDLPREELLREMRVWTPRRELIGGADAAVYLAGLIWWAAPLFAAAQIPSLRALLRAAYRWFAARRRCSAVPAVLAGTRRAKPVH